MSSTSAIAGLAAVCKTAPAATAPAATAPEATRLYVASTPAIHFPSALLGAVAAVAAVGVVFGVLSMRRDPDMQLMWPNLPRDCPCQKDQAKEAQTRGVRF